MQTMQQVAFMVGLLADFKGDTVYCAMLTLRPDVRFLRSRFDVSDGGTNRLVVWNQIAVQTLINTHRSSGYGRAFCSRCCIAIHCLLRPVLQSSLAGS